VRSINRQIVSALILSKDNKLFMGMKDTTKGGVYSDCWHIPGGGVEENENIIEALKREIKEETGIDISTLKIDLIDDKGKGTSIKMLKNGEEVECHMQFNVYKITVPKLSNNIGIKLNDDLVKYAWVDINKLNEYKLTPPSIELFKRIGWN
jgi:8-oxo-dGTP pyrophosphatase MutT (NUDIX family)